MVGRSFREVNHIVNKERANSTRLVDYVTIPIILELNIKDLNNQLENSKKQYRNAELLVKLGIKTKKELEDMNISIEQMKLNLENMIDEHQILLEKYQKPYLLSL